MVIGNTVYSLSFFKKTINLSSFHVPEHSQNDLLYWPLNLEIFLYWIFRWLSFQELSFRIKLEVTTPILAYFKTFLTVHITHSTLDFIWFALLNHQRFNDWPLFTFGELYLMEFHHFENKNLYDIEVIFARNNRKMSLIKGILIFFKRINDPRVYIYIYIYIYNITQYAPGLSNKITFWQNSTLFINIVFF